MGGEARKRRLKKDDRVYYWSTQDSKVNKAQIVRFVAEGEGLPEDVGMYLLGSGKKLRAEDLYDSRPEAERAAVSAGLMPPSSPPIEGQATGSSGALAAGSDRAAAHVQTGTAAKKQRTEGDFRSNVPGALEELVPAASAASGGEGAKKQRIEGEPALNAHGAPEESVPAASAASGGEEGCRLVPASGGEEGGLPADPDQQCKTYLAAVSDWLAEKTEGASQVGKTLAQWAGETFPISLST